MEISDADPGVQVTARLFFEYNITEEMIGTKSVHHIRNTLVSHINR